MGDYSTSVLVCQGVWEYFKEDVGFREAIEGDCFAKKRLARTERGKMLGFAALHPTYAAAGG